MSNENDWIEWSGGECPVEPDEMVDYVCRNESTEDYLSDSMFLVPPGPREQSEMTAKALESWNGYRS